MAKTSQKQIEERIEVTVKVLVPKEKWERYVKLSKVVGWKNPGHYFSRWIRDGLSELEPGEHPEVLAEFMAGPSKE